MHVPKQLIYFIFLLRVFHFHTELFLSGCRNVWQERHFCENQGYSILPVVLGPHLLLLNNVEILVSLRMCHFFRQLDVNLRE